jgi:hypothetical protein
MEDWKGEASMEKLAELVGKEKVNELQDLAE